MESKKPYTYTKNDMINFAKYLRNGLTNLEYCQKSVTEHLKDWYIKTKLSNGNNPD